MYFSTSISYIIILSPLILLALLATIGIVLYRHPSKLQRKWYSVSFKKRKRIKQIAILLGFCMAAGLFIYPLTSKNSSYQRSVCQQMKTILSQKIRLIRFQKTEEK